MDLVQINIHIQREKSCIEDLIKLIGMHTQEGRLELAAQLGRDLQNSIKTIQKLEQQKNLYITTMKLAERGILTKVVKKHVQKI